jgi:hypothetical protein
MDALFDKFCDATEEAAHAVACYALDVPVRSATIISDGVHDGAVSYAKPDPIKQQRIRMAGMLAAYRLTDDLQLHRHKSDVAAILAADAEMLPHQAAETQKFLDENWDAIAALRSELMRKGELTGDEIADCLKDHAMYKGYTTAQVEAVRKYPAEFERFIRAGGSFPPGDKRFKGAADVKDAQLKRALAQDQNAASMLPHQKHMQDLSGGPSFSGRPRSDQATVQSSAPAAMASDPPVSPEQRRAMYAAAEGRSNLGIPQHVGKEFVGKADQMPRSHIPLQAKQRTEDQLPLLGALGGLGEVLGGAGEALGGGAGLANAAGNFAGGFAQGLTSGSHENEQSTGDQGEDQSESGETQQLRQPLEDLGLPPAIVDAVCRAVANAREDNGAADEPPPTRGSPVPSPASQHANKVGGGGYAGDSALVVWDFDPMTNVMQPRQVSLHQVTQALGMDSIPKLAADAGPVFGDHIGVEMTGYSGEQHTREQRLIRNRGLARDFQKRKVAMDSVTTLAGKLRAAHAADAMVTTNSADDFFKFVPGGERIEVL